MTDLYRISKKFHANHDTAMKDALEADPDVVFLDPNDPISRGIAQQAAVETVQAYSTDVLPLAPLTQSE